MSERKRHWAGVALGGMARWATSASVALAERLFSLTLARLLSQTHPTRYPLVLTADTDSS